MSRICPECQQGKHPNCGGTTWDDATDAPAPCPCTCQAPPPMHPTARDLATMEGPR